MCNKKYTFEDGFILSQKELSKDIFEMWIETEAAKSAIPGQFISLYTDDKSKLLPRPISICEIAEDKKSLRIVYRIAGKGTKIFSEKLAGEEIKIVGPLGNGYDLLDEKAILIAGGIGIPPMLELAKKLKEKNVDINVVLGYRDAALFLKDDFEKYAKVYIATEDGSVGTKGNVLDCIKENKISGKVIYSCGPTPMLRAVKEYALENDMDAYISLEERMACGIGACLGCVCKTTDIDDHSLVKNARVCTDGPVFDAREVDI